MTYMQLQRGTNHPVDQLDYSWTSLAMSVVFSICLLLLRAWCCFSLIVDDTLGALAFGYCAPHAVNYSPSAANWYLPNALIFSTAGELHFVVLGVALQIASIFTESIRLTLVQILLQAKGVKLNPITTMYHIAPVCFVCLIVPFAFWEAESLVTHGVTVGAGVLLASAASAFGECTADCTAVQVTALTVVLILLLAACPGVVWNSATSLYFVHLSCDTRWKHVEYHLLVGFGPMTTSRLTATT